MAVSFKQGMFKGQPRQTSPPKVSLERKTKAHPLANQGQESTIPTRSWRPGSAASECHQVSKAGGIPLVPRSLCRSRRGQPLVPGKLLLHPGQALTPRKKGLSWNVKSPGHRAIDIRKHHKNKKFIFYSTIIFLICCHSYLPTYLCRQRNLITKKSNSNELSVQKSTKHI